MVSPRIRRRARERALQFLFGFEFTETAWEASIETFWEVNPAKPGVKKYAETLVRGVAKHRSALDEEIAAALENWSPQRVGKIERTVLRVALYEMRYQDDVPYKVAINEAIEVAKVFGSDDAPRFVNGVLDRLARSECRPEDS